MFSSELVQELEATITKPKLKKYFGGNPLDEMLNVFDPYIDLIEVKSKVKSAGIRKMIFYYPWPRMEKHIFY